MPTTTKTVCLQVELPEPLYDSIQEFVESRPDWTRDRLLCAALSLFLLQHGASSRETNRLYLDALFARPSDAS